MIKHLPIYRPQQSAAHEKERPLDDRPPAQTNKTRKRAFLCMNPAPKAHKVSAALPLLLCLQKQYNALRGISQAFSLHIPIFCPSEPQDQAGQHKSGWQRMHHGMPWGSAAPPRVLTAGGGSIVRAAGAALHPPPPRVLTARRLNQSLPRAFQGARVQPAVPLPAARRYKAPVREICARPLRNSRAAGRSAKTDLRRSQTPPSAAAHPTKSPPARGQGPSPPSSACACPAAQAA